MGAKKIKKKQVKKRVKPSTRPPRDPDTLPNATGGEDRLNVVLWMDWTAGSEDPVNSAFRLRSPYQPEELQLENETLTKFPGTKWIGDAKRGLHFAHSLQFDGELSGVSLDLNGPADKRGEQPGAMLSIPGRACLRLGAFAALARVRDWLRRLGAKVTCDSLTHVDLCIDFAHCEPQQLIRLLNEGYLAGYARRVEGRTISNDNNRTYNRGARKSVQLSVYDKKAQAKPSDLHLLKARRWNDTLPETALRVEFSVGKRGLRGRDIRTVADYLDKRQELARYLTHDWLRVTESQPSQSNASRAPTHRRWKEVQQAFEAVYSRPPESEVITPSRNVQPARSLGPAIAGMLEREIANHGKVPENESELLTRAIAIVEQTFRLRNSLEMIRKKRDGG